MIETTNNPLAFFLIVMSVVLITPILSERVHLPGIVGIILGGMLVGPHGFNILQDSDPIQFLATIGLVYLMFSAGLEVDIHQFQRVRSKSLVFGLITFFLPLGMGILLGRLTGMGWLGSVLLGSAFSSHTLIAFPILARMGMVRNEAVSVTVGATVLTDIGAFIVLAVVVGAQSGELSAGYFLKLTLLLAGLTMLVLLGLPRLGKLFFRRFSGRALEFQFVLVVLLVAALLAEKIGLHQVVGAFLAGLAINATLPRQSPVIGHVLFLGESFFIPVFLLFSGMITNPLAFVGNWQTVTLALGVTLVAYLSKFIAAWLASRLFGYKRDEFLTVFGLSHAQAAVTIPTLVIGLERGLFDPMLFNAAILMILLTSITSPLLVEKFASRLLRTQPLETLQPLFKRILVPIVNPATQEHLMTLANLLARSQHGKIIALHIVPEGDGHVGGFAREKELLEKVPDLLDDPESDLELVSRIENSVSHGILHVAVEHRASMILLGWRGKSTFRQNIMGSVLDEVLRNAFVPVVVGRLSIPINAIRRVLLVAPSGSLNPATKRRALDILLALSRAVNCPLVIMADHVYMENFKSLIKAADLDLPCEIRSLKGNVWRAVQQEANSEDLVILVNTGSGKKFPGTLGGLPEQLAAAISADLMVMHFNPASSAIPLKNGSVRPFGE